MKTPLYVKALYFRPERDNRLVMRGMATNREGFATPPARLCVSLNDSRDRLVGRVALTLPEVEPYATVAFEGLFRLRDMSFFTAQFRLEKLQGVDYSEFNFSAHKRRGARPGGAGFPGGNNDE